MVGIVQLVGSFELLDYDYEVVAALTKESDSSEKVSPSIFSAASCPPATHTPTSSIEASGWMGVSWSGIGATSVVAACVRGRVGVSSAL
jgi:hypothetical protein